MIIASVVQCFRHVTRARLTLSTTFVFQCTINYGTCGCAQSERELFQMQFSVLKFTFQNHFCTICVLAEKTMQYLKLHCGNVEAAGSHSKQQERYISEDTNTCWQYAEPGDALCCVLSANMNHSFAQGAGCSLHFNINKSVLLKVRVDITFLKYILGKLKYAVCIDRLFVASKFRVSRSISPWEVQPVWTSSNS